MSLCSSTFQKLACMFKTANIAYDAAKLTGQSDPHLVTGPAGPGALPTTASQTAAQQAFSNPYTPPRLLKGAALGYQALTGNLEPIKALITHLRSSGLQGMGGKQFSAELGRTVRKPISRVRPAATAAQLPGTAHLPEGVANLTQRGGESFVQVGKGKPRHEFTRLENGQLWFKPGTAGGVNPSPIASLLHEGGHFMHNQALRKSVATTPGKFGTAADNYRLKDYGMHNVPGEHADVSRLMDELGANNSALQALQQAGATERAQKFYQTARYPSYQTYVAGLPTEASALQQRLAVTGKLGYTPGYKGLEAFYKSAADVATAIRRARNATHTHPTPAQVHAGNYAKGTLTLHGLAIKLENPKGTERRGYDKNGEIAWSRPMQADYGYFAGSKAVDGDAVDCFIGPNPDSQFVAVVDQTKADGTFDESKFILGTTSVAQAEKLYLAHYPRGWKLGPMSTSTTQQLRKWLRSGKTKAPFAGQMVKAAKMSLLKRSGGKP